MKIVKPSQGYENNLPTWRNHVWKVVVRCPVGVLFCELRQLQAPDEFEIFR